MHLNNTISMDKDWHRSLDFKDFYLSLDLDSYALICIEMRPMPEKFKGEHKLNIKEKIGKLLVDVRYGIHSLK